MGGVRRGHILQRNARHLTVHLSNHDAALAVRSLLLFTLLLASTAAAQPSDEPLALPDDRVLESETGLFSLHVPEGWDAWPPSGDMLQGELVLTHAEDSTFATPLALPLDRCPEGAPSPEACAAAVLDELVFVLSGEGDPSAEAWFAVEPKRSREVGGGTFSWQSIREVYPGHSDVRGPVLHVGVLTGVESVVMVIAATPPRAAPDRWEEAVGGLHLLNPAE